jgi:hypothetical protein
VLRCADPDFLAQPLPEHPACAWVTGLALHLRPCLLAHRPDTLKDLPRSQEVVDLRLERQLLVASRLQGLFAGLSLPRLRHLSLAANGLGEEAADLLKSFPWFAGLRCFAAGASPDAAFRRSAPKPLDARSIRGDARGADFVRILVETDGYGLGERLDLHGQDLEDDSLEALARAPFLARVRRLDLRDNRIGPAGVAALAASPHAANLTELNLSSNPIGDGAAAIAASESFARLEQLALTYTGVGPSGVAAIAASLRLAKLRSLSLASDPIGDEGVQALLAEGALPSLERLDLSGATFGLASIEAISSSRLWPMVLQYVAVDGARRTPGSLDVDLRGPSTEGATPAERMALVARSTGLRDLTIRGDGSPLTADELEPLCRSPHLPGLESLQLDQIGLTDALLDRLLASPLIGSLQMLCLRGAGLGPGAGERLGRCQRLRSLRFLELTGSHLGDGVVALVSGAMRPEEIRLGETILTDETALEAGLIAGERGVRLPAGGREEFSVIDLGRRLGVLRAGGQISEDPVIYRRAVLELLARRPERARLEHLNLHLGDDPDSMLDALERVTELSSLRGLSVRAGAVTYHVKTDLPHTEGTVPEPALRRLMAMPWFGSLKRLVIDCEHGAGVLLELPDWAPESIVFHGSLPDEQTQALLRARFGERVSFCYKTYQFW